MPTHKDKPEGFDAVAERRSRELEDAVERARRSRFHAYSRVVAERDEQRAKTSVPPPGSQTS